MTAESLVAFSIASIGLALTPGPDILTVITRSITQGRGAGIVASLGFATGLVVHTTAAALGLALVLRGSPNLFAAIKFAGAAYLVYLAIHTLMAGESFLIDTAGAGRRKLGFIYRQSILMNVLNPKVTLFFLAFLPQFVTPEGLGGRVALQFVLLGVIFALCTIVTFGTCVVFAAGISGWIRRQPRAQRWLRYLTAALFLAIAIHMIFLNLH